jgi:uncharacterized protein YktA (UPF0223 family)
MNTYLNEKDTIIFLKQCLSTSVKLLIEIDELKQNKGSEKEIVKKEQELTRINVMFETINDYSGYCGYTKS